MVNRKCFKCQSQLWLWLMLTLVMMRGRGNRVSLRVRRWSLKIASLKTLLRDWWKIEMWHHFKIKINQLQIHSPAIIRDGAAALTEAGMLVQWFGGLMSSTAGVTVMVDVMTVPLGWGIPKLAEHVLTWGYFWKELTSELAVKTKVGRCHAIRGESG